ncbi:hypothetical protein ACFC5X_21485 [Streptomyces sp. NPDC055952]|uniref:hypothetical protein n=1 Tax=Streptomyces sp. NPDC055952 TaxID=3345663 RepID=UPI0035D5FDDB
MPQTLLTPVMVDTIERYFVALQGHATAEVMLEDILTPDFRTGFVDGLVWRGPDGLSEFIEARSEFFDESHEIRQISDPWPLPDGRWSARTVLWFFLRRREPAAPVSEEFTGLAFHRWEFEPSAQRSGWRVAAQMVEGFARLNDNARILFGRPEDGLTT